MPIQYDSKKIIPCPLVSVEKGYDRTGDTTKIGSKFTLTLTGNIVCSGSPNSGGEFWTDSGYPTSEFQSEFEELTSIDQKQKFLQNKMQAIRWLFAKDGLSFEVQPWDGSAPFKCYPRVVSLSFTEGVWVEKIPYTIVLEADELFGINTDFIKDAEDFNRDQDFFKDADGNKLYLSEVSENWQMEVADGEPENESNPYTFRLTHTVSATGKKAYGSDGLISTGWEQAQRWVTPRLGLDASFVNGTDALNLSDMVGYNHVRQESTDELAGSYGVTETWLLAKSNSREDFTVSIQTSAETGLTTVNVEGEVIGLDTRDDDYVLTESKWTAALAKFTSITSGGTPTVYTRAQTYSGASLNQTPISTSTGKNPISGRIQYTYSYDTRPTTCIEGALSESITITDKNPTDIFASIPVIGRAAGPVLQDMNTVSERSRTVSIEVVMPPSTICPNSAANVAAMMATSPASAVDVIINAFQADLESNYSQVFKSDDNPTWTARPTGRYSRSVTWIFQNCS